MIEVVKDLKAFLILLIYACLAYAFIYYTLTTDKPFFQALATGFLLALGSFETDDFDELLWTIFALGSLINLIVMMNLLIAVISDTFARV